MEMMSHLVAAAAIAVLCVPLAVAINGEEPARNQRKLGQTTTIAWNSPSVRKIWESARDKAIPLGERGMPEESNDRLVFFQDALSKKLSKEDLHAVASSCATMPYEGRWMDLPSMVYRAVLDLFVASGDREGLVTLLAAHFVSETLDDTTEGILVAHCGTPPVLIMTDALGKGPVFRHDVERALAHGYDEAAVVDKKDAALVKSAVDWYDKHKHDRAIGFVRLTDPILIVTDAYSRSKIPAVREKIAEALRRAFRGFGVSGKTDDEFVANAVRWYGQRKDRLWFNIKYALYGGPDDHEPLFCLEPSADAPR
jgi:hypothetical protein